MPFINSLNLIDEKIFATLDQQLVFHNNQYLRLSEILDGDTDTAFSFIKEHVCYTKLRAILDNYFLTEVYCYSEWMKLSKKNFDALHLPIEDSNPNMSANLIEAVIIKKFIHSSASLNKTGIKSHKIEAKKLLHNFIEKLYPSTLSQQTWEIILFIFIQSFSTELPYLIETLTSLSEKKSGVVSFSHYKMIAECVYHNTIFNDSESKKSNLVKLFLSQPHFADDLKSILIILSIENVGRHNLVIDAINFEKKYLKNESEIKKHDKAWKRLIEQIFTSIHNKPNLDFIIKLFFKNRELNPRWFPVVAGYPLLDIVFFRMFVECKDSPLHSYIINKNKETEGFSKTKFSQFINEMKNKFGHSYYEYTENVEWAMLDPFANKYLLCKIIEEEIEFSIQEKTPQEKIPEKTVRILLHLFVIRQMDSLKVFKYLIDSSDISEYEKISSHIDLILNLSIDISKYFIHSWINRVKNNDVQMKLVHKFIKKINASRSNNVIKEITSIFKEHLALKEKEEKKLLALKEKEAKKAEKELLTLIELEENKKPKKKKKKKKLSKSEVILEKEAIELEVEIKSEENKNPPKQEFILEKEPEKEELKIQNSIHFSYDLQKNLCNFSNISKIPNLFPPITKDHPALSILRSMTQFCKSIIHTNQDNPPILTCYGSTARLLFEKHFIENNENQKFNDIDLHLHFPVGSLTIPPKKVMHALQKYGANNISYSHIPAGQGPFLQFKFTVQDTDVELTFSLRPLIPVLDLPTIICNLNQADPVEKFYIPKIFYNDLNNIQKIIALHSEIEDKDLLNPTILSFIWKQIAHLRASGYNYDPSFINKMNRLESDLLNKPEIIHAASEIFFKKYFPKNQKFFSDYLQEPAETSALNPCLLTKRLYEYTGDAKIDTLKAKAPLARRVSL